jgi:mannose-6-phosphate isomerase-like protein (cupin superfamily)
MSEVKRKTLRFGRGFRVAFGNRRAQAAEMVIAPGGSEGGPGNRHRGADQWLFVVAGTGLARIAGRPRALRRGTLLLIERGVAHEVRNTGRTPLQTLNVYVPPAYRHNGDPLPRGRR